MVSHRYLTHSISDICTPVFAVKNLSTTAYFSVLLLPCNKAVVVDVVLVGVAVIVNVVVVVVTTGACR